MVEKIVLMPGSSEAVLIGTSLRDLLGRKVIGIIPRVSEGLVYLKLGLQLDKRPPVDSERVQRNEEEFAGRIICVALEALYTGDDDTGYVPSVWNPSFLSAAVAGEIFHRIEQSAFVEMGFISKEGALAYRSWKMQRDLEREQAQKRLQYEELKKVFEPAPTENRFVAVIKPKAKIIKKLRSWNGRKS